MRGVRVLCASLGNQGVCPPIQHTMTSYKYGPMGADDDSPSSEHSSDDSLSSNSSFHNDYGYTQSELSTSLTSDLLSSYTPHISMSLPANHHDTSKPRILLMGLRRSGKSSIQKVVFQKMSPHETLFLESTNKIVKNDISNNSFVQFQIWDFPGQINFFDNTFDGELIFGGCGAMVFVIDAQDDYQEAIIKLNQTVQQAYQVNNKIVFEVFIHKVDGISQDHRIEIKRDIEMRLREELMDNDMNDIPIRYHMTSIYDHTIFEAFSKVIQKLIPQLGTLENLLDMLVSNSRLEKAFLFDVVSKIYVATDSTPVDNSTYELCSDMIDVVIDISCIYGNQQSSKKQSLEGDGFAYDEESSCVIHLSNNTVLYLREVNRYLALVCLIQKESFNKIGLINYNFECFKKAITEVFDVEEKLQQQQQR